MNLKAAGSENSEPKKLKELLNFASEDVKNELSQFEGVLTPDEVRSALKRLEIQKEAEKKRKAYWQFVNSDEKPTVYWGWREYLEDISAAFEEEGNKLVIDDENRFVIESLAKYFTKSPEFEQIRPGYSLEKGILLHGNVGVGKSQLMKVFRYNQRHSYDIKDCSDITAEFQKSGEDGLAKYFRDTDIKYKNDFGHKKSGWCFDDLGVESDGRYFGNSVKVMERIIDVRYRGFKEIGLVTHMITNLSATEIKANYGIRFADRCREMFNIISFPEKAESRRGR